MTRIVARFVTVPSGVKTGVLLASTVAPSIPADASGFQMFAFSSYFSIAVTIRPEPDPVVESVQDGFGPGRVQGRPDFPTAFSSRYLEARFRREREAREMMIAKIARTTAVSIRVKPAAVHRSDHRRALPSGDEENGIGRSGAAIAGVRVESSRPSGRIVRAAAAHIETRGLEASGDGDVSPRSVDPNAVAGGAATPGDRDRPGASADTRIRPFVSGSREEIRPAGVEEQLGSRIL